MQGNNFPQDQCSPIIAQAIDELRAKILDLSSSITMLATTVAKQHQKTLHEPAQATNPESPLKILELTKKIQNEMEVLERHFEPEIEPIKSIKENVKEAVPDCDTSDEWTMLDQN